MTHADYSAMMWIFNAYAVEASKFRDIIYWTGLVFAAFFGFQTGYKK